MSEEKFLEVAIVDFGMGNLFSVKHACHSVGLNAAITASKKDILAARAVILPGVGAFSNAVKNLKKLDLFPVLREVAASSTPLMGICLGMHLFMSESYEFGIHKGLDIIPGSVIRFNDNNNQSERIKVPHVGWNHVKKVKYDNEKGTLRGGLLRGIEDGAFMYFVHSFYTVLEDSKLILSRTKYGGVNFCSSFKSQNIFACQFHPERSGPQGLKIYENLASIIKKES